MCEKPLILLEYSLLNTSNLHRKINNFQILGGQNISGSPYSNFEGSLPPVPNLSCTSV